jgi:hypothetical protein
MTSISERKFTEEQLQLSWCRIKSGTQFFAVDGSAVEIYSPGIWNLEAGPDFRNAKLAINGKLHEGSVEIHKKSSDWVNHGHFTDNRYKDIILHVVAEDDTKSLSSERRRYLPDAPVVIIKPIFSATRIAPADKFPKGKCQAFFSLVEDNELNLFFRKAGLRRFYGKVEFTLNKMKNKGINRAFTELLFDACGYKQNRENFIELFSRLSRYENLSEVETEAVIWGESGLLPDPVSVKLDTRMEQFVKDLWRIWWQIRKEPLPDIKWRHSGLRPMNFPERRIAAVTVLMKKIGKLPVMFFANLAENKKKPSDLTKAVIEIMKCNHPVWDKYINFTSRCATPAGVLGKSRAEDICINVILPALQAQRLLAEKKSDDVPQDSIHDSIAEQAFLSMSPIQSNRILETASLKWFAPPGRKRSIIKDAVSQQGVLHIYQNFCEDVCSECSECPLSWIQIRSAV